MMNEGLSLMVSKNSKTLDRECYETIIERVESYVADGSLNWRGMSVESEETIQKKVLKNEADEVV